VHFGLKPSVTLTSTNVRNEAALAISALVGGGEKRAHSARHSSSVANRIAVFLSVKMSSEEETSRKQEIQVISTNRIEVRTCRNSLQVR
jgi:hypothetical protein